MSGDLQKPEMLRRLPIPRTRSSLVPGSMDLQQNISNSRATSLAAFARLCSEIRRQGIWSALRISFPNNAPAAIPSRTTATTVLLFAMAARSPLTFPSGKFSDFLEAL